MSVDVEMNGKADAGNTTFADTELPAGRYCFHVGAGGQLVILVEERGESQVDCVYSPAAWRSVRGDVWRKGALLQS
jgi:hypothetical protein